MYFCSPIFSTHTHTTCVKYLYGNSHRIIYEASKYNGNNKKKKKFRIDAIKNVWQQKIFFIFWGDPWCTKHYIHKVVVIMARISTIGCFHFIYIPFFFGSHTLTTWYDCSCMPGKSMFTRENCIFPE